MMKANKRSNHKSFTLIELILVIAIVAILAGAIVPMILSARQEARISKALVDLEALRTAFKEFNADTGLNTVPPIDLFRNPPASPIAGWDGPYIDQILADPWGSPYFSWVIVGGVFGVPNRFGYYSVGPNEWNDLATGDDVRVLVNTYNP